MIRISTRHKIVVSFPAESEIHFARLFFQRKCHHHLPCKFSQYDSWRTFPQSKGIVRFSIPIIHGVILSQPIFHMKEIIAAQVAHSRALRSHPCKSESLKSWCQCHLIVRGFSSPPFFGNQSLRGCLEERMPFSTVFPASKHGGMLRTHHCCLPNSLQFSH